MNIRHPEITVQLVGGDGNAVAILGAVQRAMRKAGLPKAELDAFMEEALAGDYTALLGTCCRWVDVQ